MMKAVGLMGSSGAGASAERVLCNTLRHGEYCCVVAPTHLSRRLWIQAVECLRPLSSEDAVPDQEPEPGADATAPVKGHAEDEPVTLVALHLAELEQCSTTEQWYQKLLAQLGSQVGLGEELEAFWQRELRLSPLQRWMAALRELLLLSHPASHIPRPSRLVIWIDEIEAVRALPFSTDEFFSAIRECYNRRSRDAQFQRLSFCLVGTSRLATLIRDPRTTWFNIGQRIELTEEQDAPATGAPRSPRRAADRRAHRICHLLKRPIDWITGKPYHARRDARKISVNCRLILCPGL